MKKKLIFLSLIVLTIVSCSKKVVDPQTKGDTVDSHSAQTSLDYKGSYNGVLPCADCEGVKTVITLSDESKYSLVKKYLGKDDKEFRSEGTYTFNKEGNTVVLSNEEKGFNTYFVGENTLTALDSKGKKITGELADKYILRKDNLMGTDNTSGLQGLKYRLIELEGVPLVRDENDLFIQFDKEGKFTAYVGCNNINGMYETSESHNIKFSKVISTMKACKYMYVEDQFLKFLEMTDIYMKEDEFLSLKKGSLNLLRFKEMK